MRSITKRISSLVFASVATLSIANADTTVFSISTPTLGADSAYKSLSYDESGNLTIVFNNPLGSGSSSETYDWENGKLTTPSDTDADIIVNYDSVSNNRYTAGTTGADITNSFVGVATSVSSSAYGGVIYNYVFSSNSSIGNITGDFISNSLENTGSISQSTNSAAWGGAIHNRASNASTSTVKISSNFIGNSVKAYGGAYGGAIANYAMGSGSITISDGITGDYIGNSATSTGYYAYGGAIYNYASNTATITITNGITGDFIGNFVSSNGYGGYGGAIYSYVDPYTADATSIKLGNVEGNFVGNYALSTSLTTAKGGAIYLYNADITLTATTGDIYNYGNWAGTSTSKSDEYGGFLYLDKSATATFDVDESYTMTIGDGTANYDSIASKDTSALIEKTGDGTLTVNSSMQYFIGTLNVTEGTMNVNNFLGASAINIAEYATLSLTINGANTFNNSSLTSSTFDNDGTLQLIAGVSLDAGSYSISASGITDFGSVVAYGGTYANGKFTMGSVESATVTGNEATFDTSSISSNSNIKIVKNSSTDVVDVMLSFDLVDSSSISGTTATDVTDTTVIGDMTTLSAWDFDIVLSDGDTVVLTYYIGSVEDSSLLALYHVDGSTTTDESDSIISYDGEYIVFEVDSFSTWAVVSVPEPSTYAMIFGALALGLAVYRRRK